jgi:hypothetical protein
MAKLRDQSRVFGDLNVDESVYASGSVIATSLSGSLDYSNLTNVPSGIVSSSTQATTWTVESASFATTASYAENALSASYAPVELPAGTVSSSTQATTWTVESASFAETASFALNAGGGSIEITSSAPSDPSEGDLWYDNTTGKTYIYYVSESVEQWVLQSDPTYNPGPSLQDLQDVTDLSNITSNAIIITNDTTATSKTTGALIVSGGLGVGKSIVATSFTGSIRYSDVVNVPTGLVSSSGQVTSLLPSGVVSASSQVNYNNISNVPLGIVSSSGQVVSLLPDGTVSASSQVSYTGLSNIPTGIVSSSSQVSYAGLSNIPSGIVSSSEQVTTLLPTGTVSSSDQIISALPDGTVSSSTQAITWTVESSSFSVSASFAETASFALNASAGSGFPFEGDAVITGSLLITGSGTSTPLQVSTPTGSILFVTSSARVGINLNNPQYALHVSGAIFATDNVTAFSDKRVKDNVTPIKNALFIVQNLDGVRYTRNDSDTDKQYIGFIAQDVLEVLPEVVEGSEEHGYGISYGNITALLVQAIKEQQKQIDELKSQLVDRLC